VSEFRTLLLIAAASGALAGLVWFGAQYFAVIPLIQTAEVYEARHSTAHEDEGWKPQNGWQRNAFTATATVLTGIGQAAILFGLIFLLHAHIGLRNGALWGLAAFACFSLAPALGLPPQPPGVAVADLVERQVWWAATVISTATGFILIAAPRISWLLKILGGFCIAMPHLIGAPIATGESMVPAQLVRQFAIASLAASGIFWLTLGVVGGFLCDRYASRNGPATHLDGLPETYSV
jgi:cobalt transporter subunit CbtA